jgi:hypothetical protein
MLPGMAYLMADLENPVLAYLERSSCTDCKIDDAGVLNHCETHQKMYDAALAHVKIPAPPLTYEEKKKMEAERFMEVAHMRNSHNWVGSRTFVDPGRTRMTPYASHCKACGLAMAMFKVKPAWCPKNPKPEQP